MTNNTVTLIDGREVSSSSEEWRHECECRYISRLPTTEARHRQLDLIGKFRGPEAKAKVARLAQKIFYADQAAKMKEREANNGM